MRTRYGFLTGIALIMMAMLAGNATADVVGDLVLYLSFDEGGNPVDHADNPAKVSIKGDLKPVDGKIARALEFDGKSANIVEVQHAEKLEGMEALTIAAWAKPRKPDAQEGMSIASKRLAFNNGDVYNLFIWTGQTMRARVNGKGEIASKTVFEDDVWYHVAYVFDGNAGGNEKVKLFVNGELETSGNHPDDAVGEGGAPLWIGELDANRGFAWNGVIDEVGIWRSALAEDEIRSVMDQGLVQILPVERRGKLTTTWSEIKTNALD